MSISREASSLDRSATSFGTRRRSRARSGLLVVALLTLSLLGFHAAPALAGEPESTGTDSSLGSARLANESGGCVASSTVLCLHDGRFEVTLQFTANAETAPAKVAAPRTADSGLFYFFGPNNWEMLLKVLNGCGFNQHYWVFAASATDVGLRLQVRDTMLDDSVKVYTKGVGQPAPAITDVQAFPMSCNVG